MKTVHIIFIPLFLLCSVMFAQTKIKKNQKKEVAVKKEVVASNKSLKLFTVSGKVTQTSSYCGGAAPPEEMLEDLAKPKAYPGKIFYIKKGDKNNLKEAVVLNFKTDANGKFSFQLPAGIYSIILEPQLKALNLKDYNKTKEESADEDCLKKWWAKAYYVLEIIDKDKSDIIFAFHHPCFTSCDIPCLEYRGPMPP